MRERRGGFLSPLFSTVLYMQPPPKNCHPLLPTPRPLSTSTSTSTPPPFSTLKGEREEKSE